jgi:hypothetical protein
MMNWLDDPEEHDYPAAENYLSLLTDDETAYRLSEMLEAASTVHFKAKDILRASGLPLLDIGNKHVKKDLDKVHDGKKLSPILLVKDSTIRHPLIIADGYHRVCASYYLDENTDIPCRIVEM